MYCSDQQIRLIRVFSLFNAKTGYSRLDTAKSLDQGCATFFVGGPLTNFRHLAGTHEKFSFLT